MKNRSKNMIFGEDTIIYTAIKLYNEDTQFRMPTYLINEVIDNNKKLIIKHNGENLCYYNGDEILKHLVSVDRKLYKGSFKNQSINFNLGVFNIKSE